MSFEADGFEIIPSAVEPAQLRGLQIEVNRLLSSGTAGARNILARSQQISDLASSPRFTAQLPGDHYRPVRSLLFDKTPEANWPVAWHQDRTITVTEKQETEGYGPWTYKHDIYHVEPPAELLESMITLRIHLDDASQENGPLLVIPGSHRKGKIPPETIPRLTQIDTTTVTCKAGDVVKMSPLLLHSSRRATAPSHRRVIHLEFADPGRLPNGLSWAEWRNQ